MGIKTLNISNKIIKSTKNSTKSNQKVSPISKYGWKPDVPDFRDHLYNLKSISVLPSKVDLRTSNLSVLDQGNLGSCTANAIANAHRFNQIKQGVKNSFIPSRLFIYYNERSLEGTTRYDAGAYIRDGVKTVVKQGVCLESTLKYNISQFTKKPSSTCYNEALKHQAVSYERITDLHGMKNCLANGFPFVFGFSVYSSFESDEVERTGIVPMPSNDDYLLGGHAVLAMGYDDSTSRFLVMNSWGASWGMRGYFTIPYEYLADNNLADDFWTITFVEK